MPAISSESGSEGACCHNSVAPLTTGWRYVGQFATAGACESVTTVDDPATTLAGGVAPCDAGDVALWGAVASDDVFAATLPAAGGIRFVSMSMDVIGRARVV